MRPATALLVVGAVVVAVGSALLARAIGAYLASPLPVSSSSGVSPFRLPDGTFGGYLPLRFGLEPVVIGVGLVLVVAALVVGAVQSSLSRESTSCSNAEAHTR